MNRGRLAVGLLIANGGVFLLTTAFLPPANSFLWRTGSFLSWYCNSRDHWEIAWVVLGASLILSGAVYLILTAFDQK